MSIILVLGTHLLPLGPKTWQLNVATGVLGMAIFFILSGFLITEFLIKRPDAGAFIIRRLARILPLFYLYSVITLWWFKEPADTWFATLGFYANMPPQRLIPATAHLWSLCLEVQFYIAMALWCFFSKSKAYWAIILATAAFTGLRIAHGQHASSISYYRADEIMAGCMLALAFHGKLGPLAKKALGMVHWGWLLALLVLSCDYYGGALNYLRPYLAALLVGHTLAKPDSKLAAFLGNTLLAYLASISFALYIIHPLLATTWLGEGDTGTRYLKRPLLLLTLWGLAHLSSRCFENRFIAWARRVTTPATTPTAGALPKQGSPQ